MRNKDTIYSLNFVGLLKQWLKDVKKDVEVSRSYNSFYLNNLDKFEEHQLQFTITPFELEKTNGSYKTRSSSNN